MTEQSKTRIPAPLYAVAGASDLAYEQLRKLPAVVTELRGKAAALDTAHLRHRATTTSEDMRERAIARLKAANESANGLRAKAAAGDIDLDVDKLRDAARRNAKTLLTEAKTGAKTAQVRAVEVYLDLVARGERVVGTGVVRAADTVNSDMEATEAAEVTAAPATPVATASPAGVAAADSAGGSAEAAAGNGKVTGDVKPTKAVKRTKPASN